MATLGYTTAVLAAALMCWHAGSAVCAESCHLAWQEDIMRMAMSMILDPSEVPVSLHAPLDRGFETAFGPVLRTSVSADPKAVLSPAQVSPFVCGDCLCACVGLHCSAIHVAILWGCRHVVHKPGVVVSSVSYFGRVQEPAVCKGCH